MTNQIELKCELFAECLDGKSRTLDTRKKLIQFKFKTRSYTESILSTSSSGSSTSVKPSSWTLFLLLLLLLDLLLPSLSSRLPFSFFGDGVGEPCGGSISSWTPETVGRACGFCLCCWTLDTFMTFNSIFKFSPDMLSRTGSWAPIGWATGATGAAGLLWRSETQALGLITYLNVSFIMYPTKATRNTGAIRL